jgi:hypothetical protein
MSHSIRLAVGGAWLIATITSGACVPMYADNNFAPVNAVTDTGPAADTNGATNDTAVNNDTGASNDTGFGSSALVTCITNKCVGQLAACQSNSGCISVMQCISHCGPNDMACVGNCIGMAPNLATEDLVTCASTSCSASGSSSCPNGSCEGGETPQNCPADCANP